jgi:hypothetical protein
MKTETDCKRVFKHSVKHIGGKALSLNSAIQTGLPDLYVNIPGRAPFLTESKYIKDPSAKFNLAIKYTALQKDTLEKLNEVNEGSAWGTIFIKFDRNYYVVFVPAGIDRISYLFRETYSWAIYNKSLKIFELDKCLDTCKIPFIHKKDS